MAALLAVVGEKTAFAQAQQFGDHGQLVITAENLFGFSVERHGWDTAANTENSETYNQFGLFYRSPISPTARGPWVGAHYFVIPNLSIGATLGFQTAGGSETRTTMGGTTTITTDRNSQFAFIFLPKVGYALMFNNTLGFWFRGGPGFARNSSSNQNNDGGSASSRWFLSLDALFVVTPVQYFGFYAGPQGNISFAGSDSVTTPNGVTTSVDASFRSFSLDAGIFGYFNL
ncbi:MAG TPA: hypothetical protein VK540_30555 [Polyangiaceae bacterium]|nr:hypothetical protein [Polyangiaceae bacterium]